MGRSVVPVDLCFRFFNCLFSMLKWYKVWFLIGQRLLAVLIGEQPSIVPECLVVIKQPCCRHSNRLKSFPCSIMFPYLEVSTQLSFFLRCAWLKVHHCRLMAESMITQWIWMDLGWVGVYWSAIICGQTPKFTLNLRAWGVIMSQDILPEAKHTMYTGGVREIDHTKARKSCLVKCYKSKTVNLLEIR